MRHSLNCTSLVSSTFKFLMKFLDVGLEKLGLKEFRDS